MLRLLPLFLLLLSCSDSTEQQGHDLGPYQYSAPMDVEPADGWNDNAEDAAWEKREEQRIYDSTAKAEDAGFARWADSMAAAVPSR